jgi:hypothetical protein
MLMDLKNLDEKPKVQYFCPMFVIFQKEFQDFGKENHRLDLGLKNLCDFHFSAGIFKLLRSPGIDTNESIPPAYQARTTTLFLLGS